MKTGDLLRIGAAIVIVAIALLAVSLGRAPLWLIGLYAGVGVLSFGNYWVDKRAAITNRWRTSEAKLHGLDLVGGIAGGLVAQVALRHKTSKPEYALVTAGIAVLHVAGLIALIFGVYDLGA
jgi:uncharacterized membrane protein YsdA (DUF1294 family)